MSNENKALIRRYFDLLAGGDDATALCAEDVRNHSAIPEAQGAAGLRRIHQITRQVAPDLAWKVEDTIAEADRVVCRVKLTGTQTGPLMMTRLKLPASNKPFETEQLHIFRLEGGRIVEMWNGRDDLGLLRQLGHFPPQP